MNSKELHEMYNIKVLSINVYKNINNESFYIIPCKFTNTGIRCEQDKFYTFNEKFSKYDIGKLIKHAIQDCIYYPVDDNRYKTWRISSSVNTWSKFWDNHLSIDITFVPNECYQMSALTRKLEGSTKVYAGLLNRIRLHFDKDDPDDKIADILFKTFEYAE